MSTCLAQLEIFYFDNGGSGMKHLPCSSSSGGIVKSIRFFPMSNLEDDALVDAIAENGSAFFSLCKKVMKIVEIKNKRKKLKLGIYSLSVACLGSNTWHPRGDFETISCTVKWSIDASGEVKADLHIHDLLENRSDDEIMK